MIRSWLRTAAILFLAFGALFGAAAPAAHAAGELELSVDGVNWGQGLPPSLFDLSQKLIPGESHSAELWVRNSGQATAQLSAKVTAPSWQGLIADGTVQVRAAGPGGDRQLRNVATVLFALPGGQSERITLTILMLASAGNSAELQSFPVGFELSLRQAVADLGANAQAGSKAEAQADANSNAGSNAGAKADGSNTGGSNNAGSTSGSASNADAQAKSGAEGAQLPTTGFPTGTVLLAVLLAAVLIASGTGLRSLGRQNKSERTESLESTE